MRARPTMTVTIVCATAMAIAPSAAAGQFDYTNTSTPGSWTVPTGASVVQVVLQGAAGGNGASVSGGAGGSGGSGANIASSINVSAGEVLDIGLGRTGTSGTGASGAGVGGSSGFAGGGGSSNGNGGGGGGASAVQIASTTILVSGGGGGGGGANGDVAGGASLDPNPTGGSGGSAGSGYVLLNGSSSLNGSPGTVGSNRATAAGGGGTGSGGGTRGDTMNATVGSANNGGLGGNNADFCGGGGGGGGYFGGGGGGAATAFESSGCSGGGAGSSFMAAARTGTNRIISDGPTGSAGRAQVNFIDFTTSSLNSGTVGQAYSQNVVATFAAATAPDVWAVSPALPAGLTLNTATGAITGTPTSAASGTYTITASYNPGGLGLIARSAISLTLIIASAPADNTTNNLQTGTGDSAIAPRLTGTGGPWTVKVGVPAIVIPASNSGTFARYAISPALPDGLSLDPTSGVISGTASSPSASTLYTLTATNTAGSSSLAFRLAVNEAMLAKPGAAKGAQTLTKVAFAGSATRLSGRAKQRLMSRVRDVDTPVRISVEVSDPSSSTQMRVAYARGIAIRQFLRSQGATVESTIALAPQVGASSAPRAWVRTSA